MRSPRTRARHRVDRTGDHAAPKRRRIWPWITGVGIVLLLAIGVVAWVGSIFAREALSVRDDLAAAKNKLGSIPALVESGNSAAIEAAASDALALTTRAEKTVQGDIWGFAAGVPFVGQNVAAVRSATEATHILARDAVPVGVRLLETMTPESLKVEGGGINLEPFVQAQADLPTINAAFAAAKAKIDPIELDDLHPVVSDALTEVVEVIDQVAPALEGLEKYLPTLLPMLGQDGPRQYMVLFQNNAEIRATGGNPSWFTIMQVDNGAIHMREDWVVDQAFNMGLSGVQYYHDVAPETAALYESNWLRYSQNYSRTPDFPTQAAAFESLWGAASGEGLDGVISLDPPLLAAMLAVTGPVDLSDGTQITSDNVVSTLLFDVYERFGLDNDASDRYFSEVIDRVFDKLTGGDWDPLGMLDALETGVSDQRIYAQFDREQEQALAVELGIDGALTADNARKTQVGVFVNDVSISKLEYFYSQEVAVTCDASAGTMTTTLTMHNSITDPNLNGYTLAWRNDRVGGFPNTTMALDVVYFAPPGSTITASDPASGDASGWDRAGAERGHEAKSLLIAVPMGESRTVSFTSTIPEGDLGPLSVRFAPTVTDTPVTIDGSCGGL